MLYDATLKCRSDDLTSEQDRLAALDTYDVLDTPNEEIFDRITRMACRLLEIEISTITFVDGHRQWFKSCLGLTADETAREPSFCQHAIRSHRALIISDALADERFSSNALVTGEPFIRSYAGMPLAPNNGPALGTLCVIGRAPRVFDAEQLAHLSDLARMAEAALELRKLATLDGLTGCQTRRAFRERFGQALSLAARHQHDVALLVFDIDHFKRINDTFGHAAGDVVLRSVVDVCRRNLRSTDFIGRLGGEEFAVALPHTDRQGAVRVAELLRSAIEAAPFEATGVPVSATASFGVASRLAEGDNPDAMVSRADEALYQAKNAGRNRTVTSSDIPNTADTGRRVLKAGLIVFNLGQSTLKCTVCRLSDIGARVQVVSQARVPDAFKLQIEADGFSRACRVLERKGSEIIISFGDAG